MTVGLATKSPANLVKLSYSLGCVIVTLLGNSVAVAESATCESPRGRVTCDAGRALCISNGSEFSAHCSRSEEERNDTALHVLQHVFQQPVDRDDLERKIDEARDGRFSVGSVVISFGRSGAESSGFSPQVDPVDTPPSSELQENHWVEKEICLDGFCVTLTPWERQEVELKLGCSLDVEPCLRRYFKEADIGDTTEEVDTRIEGEPWK